MSFDSSRQAGRGNVSVGWGVTFVAGSLTLERAVNAEFDGF